MAGKEAVFSALSSFIRGMNFDGKRRFITEFDGLSFISSLLTDETATASLRLYKKVLVLIQDLVVNDDNIMKDNSMFVRNYFAVGDNKVAAQLIKVVEPSCVQFASDLTVLKNMEVRNNSLRILYRLHQTNTAELKDIIVPILNVHKERLQAKLESCAVDS